MQVPVLMSSQGLPACSAHAHSTGLLSVAVGPAGTSRLDPESDDGLTE